MSEPDGAFAFKPGAPSLHRRRSAAPTADRRNPCVIHLGRRDNVTVKQSGDGSAPNRAPNPDGPKLPLRWVVILGLSAATVVLIGAAEGVAVGMVAGVLTAGTLHKLME